MATCAKSSECRHAGLLCRGSRNIVRKNPLPEPLLGHTRSAALSPVREMPSSDWIKEAERNTELLNCFHRPVFFLQFHAEPSAALSCANASEPRGRMVGARRSVIHCFHPAKCGPRNPWMPDP
jgi:hypothetical protein